MKNIHYLPSNDDEFMILLERLINLKNEFIKNTENGEIWNKMNDLMWVISDFNDNHKIPYQKLLCLQHVINNTPEMDWWIRQIHDFINKIKDD